MAYEAQIAGVGDDPAAPALRTQRDPGHAAPLGARAARRAAPRPSPPSATSRRLEFVNGGGTGSLETTASEPAVTEVAAGSGLYGPALFDTYRHFQPAPGRVLRAVGGAPPVTAHGDGGRRRVDRLGHARLRPAAHAGLAARAAPDRRPRARARRRRPLFGPGAARCAIGDRVWFRHTKAGELCEHVDELHLVDGDRVVATVPTYRGRRFRVPVTPPLAYRIVGIDGAPTVLGRPRHVRPGRSPGRQRAYAAGFGDKGELALPPARGFAILTCMDARLDPAKYAGLAEGDAHVIRNAGGRASDDAIRSLVISYKLLGTREWFVIHHTNCGMEFFTDEVIRGLLANSLETAALGRDRLPRRRRRARLARGASTSTG